MKLQSQRVIAEREGLVRRKRRRRKACGPAGQIEGIAMPVQEGDTVKVLEARRATFGRERHRRPADLLRAGSIDPGTEGSRHELAAETDAERRLVRSEPHADQSDLVVEGKWTPFVGQCGSRRKVESA